MPRRLIVGISGSSASELGVTLLKALRVSSEIETHLVVSAGASHTLRFEVGLDVKDVEAMADYAYSPSDLLAAISSGSFITAGMVVIPCSMRTLGAIATGNSQDLLTRAADVCLKERRKLVLVTRESPLNLVHIKNMEAVTLAGAIVQPPVVAFYHRPETIEDMLGQIVGKVLDQFGIEHDLFKRWEGSAGF